MTKAERLIYIINLFRLRRKLTLDQLVEECRVSKRTLYRDLISLSNMNIPIYNDDGYRLARDVTLPPMNFSADEMEVLGLALKCNPLLKSRKFTDILKKIEIKIASTTRDSKSSDLCRFVACNIKKPKSLSAKQESILGRFFDAMLDERKISIRYNGRKKACDDLQPIGLEILNDSWQLITEENSQAKPVKIGLRNVRELSVEKREKRKINKGR